MKMSCKLPEDSKYFLSKLGLFFVRFLLYFSTLVRPEDSKDEKMLHYYLSVNIFLTKTIYKSYFRRVIMM